MENLIALKDLRLNMDKYAAKVKAGASFIVLKQSKPLFKIVPIVDDERWEVLADFTKIKKGGVDIDELLTRL